MRKLNSFLVSIALLAAAVSLQAQTVTVDKTQLTFSALVGTTPSASQTINVSAATAGTFYTAVSNVAWLKMTNASNTTPQTGISGTTPSAVSVIADPTGMQTGTYSGVIAINSVQVAVTFTISSIGVSPQTLSLTCQTGGTVPAATALTLTGTGAFTAAASTASGGNWLQVSPTSGTVSGTSTLNVILDPTITPALAPGTYTGQITITPTVGNVPVPVAVTLTVTAAPTVSASATAVNINYQISGANNVASQNITLTTNSTQPLTYGVTSSVNNNPAGRNWILISPSSGTIAANGSVQVTVSYDTTAALPAGTWTGLVTVFTPGAVPAQQNIQVTLLVSSAPLLSLPSAALNFTYELNGAVPAAQTITASSSAVATSATTGQMPITVTVTPSNGWLSVTPPTGVASTQLTTGMPLTIAVNPSGLAIGPYTGTITVTGTGAGNGPQTLQVNLSVANDPLINTNAPSNGLFFQSQIGQNPVATTQTSQNITVSSSSGATLNYTATAATTTGGSGWLVLSGTTSGSTNGTFTVTVVPGSLAAGTYNGTITIAATNPATGNAAINSPMTIPVTLYVSSGALLVPTLPGNSTSLPTFTAAVNGAPPAQQAITLNSSNPATVLNYSVSFTTSNGGNSWLFVAPATGTTAPGSNVVNVQVAPGLLSAGTYTGSITITATAPGGGAVANSPVTIPVQFTVTGGTLNLSATSLSFTQTAGGPAPAAQPVQITSSGQAFNYTAVASVNSGSVNWLSVTPASATGTTPGSISVVADGSKLSPGTYTGTITVTAPNATAATVQVKLTVNAGTLSAPTTTLTFTQALGAAVPAAKTIAVTGAPGPLNFSVTTNVTNGSGWLTAVVGTGTATTGTTPANVTVSVSAGSGANALAAGTYSGNVVITSPGTTGSITVPVVFNVVPAQTISLSGGGTLNFNYTIGVGTTPLTQTVNLTASGTPDFTATASTTDKGSWLSVTPATGTASSTATPLTVSVDPKNLAAGSYTGTITISSTQVVTPLTLAVNLTVVAVPAPVLTSIKNAASYTTLAVSPGELVALFGTNLGPSTLTFGTVTGGKRATTVAGTQVLFGNTPAPIYYVSATQTAVFVPYEVGGQATTQVTVVTQGATSTAVTYNVVPAQPGIFTQNSQGTGPGSILNQDYSINGPNNGAAPGSIIQIYMTGEGETSPGGVTGSSIPSDGSGLKKPVLAVTASIGGISLPASSIVYAGSAPGTTSGVFQVDLIVPTTLGTGPQALTVSVGGVSSQPGVTVQVTAKP